MPDTRRGGCGGEGGGSESGCDDASDNIMFINKSYIICIVCEKYKLNILHNLLKKCHNVRVVKEMDLKSIGHSPRRFESYW